MKPGLVSTSGLLLRRVDYRDSDLMLTLLTEHSGKLSALARGARRSRKRFGGSLEPLHQLQLELQPAAALGSWTLTSSQITQDRLGILSNLDKLNAAGQLLDWVRRSATEGIAEPEVFRTTVDLLDTLNQPNPESSSGILASYGLRLLKALGWELELAQCVRCGKPCPESKSARVSPKDGGLLCSTCGLGRYALSGRQRAALRAATNGTLNAIAADQQDVVLALIEEALQNHANLS